jgi:thymidine kinase
MFLEHTGSRSPRKGWIEVICGSMFSGKTEELIRRLRRAEFAKQRVEIFKPSVDTRYAASEVVSHDSTSIRSTPVPNSSNLLLLAGGIEVVGIDEAQFFDEGLPEVCAALANQGVRVIAAGLDMDFLGRPFGPMPSLLSIAEYVTKVHAICMRCGALANFSHRTSASADLVVLGEKDHYEPLCRACFDAARAEVDTAAR